MKKTITICSSGSFYKDVIKYKNELKKLGFNVLIPVTATKMEKSGDYDIMKHKLWYADSSKYYQKTAKMKGHLVQIDKGDAIFVVNLTKKGIKGYIGGNGLVEIFYAWMKKKPIYILNQVSDKCSFKEEVLGLNPVFINGDITKIY
jgi:hypothetical protein